MSKLALVLAGGGARAAYQAGVLARVAEECPELSIPILTGVSAGAINATFLANRDGNFREATQQMVQLWSELRTEEVLRVAPLSLLWNLMSWSLGLLAGGVGVRSISRGLVNTEPLYRLLDKALSNDGGLLRHVPNNLREGRLSALAVTTTNYATGQAVTFIEGQAGGGWQRPYRVSQTARLSVDHVLASSAIPLLFPAVKLGRAWHGDGGVRQTAPLAPAIYLGADKILAVSTLRTPSPTPPEDTNTTYPPPAQILGILLNSIFLDNIDYDATNLERINQLQGRRTDPDPRLRPVRLLVLQPSEDLGNIAGQYESRLPWTFRYLTRGWGTKETSKSDLLATMLFEGAYTQHLIEIGRRDAEDKMDEILAFLKA